MHEKIYGRAGNLPVFFKTELVCVRGVALCCAELASRVPETARLWWWCVGLGARLPSLVPASVFLKLAWSLQAQRTVYLTLLHVIDHSKLRIIIDEYSWPLLIVLLYHSL